MAELMERIDKYKVFTEEEAMALIEKIKLEKWNGTVPQVQGSSTPIVDIKEYEHNNE